MNKILQSAVYFAIMRPVTPCDGTCWSLEMMSSTTQKPPFLRDGWFLIVKGISLIAKIAYIESYPDNEKNTYTHLQLSDDKARVYRASSMTKTRGPGYAILTSVPINAPPTAAPPVQHQLSSPQTALSSNRVVLQSGH